MEQRMTIKNPGGAGYRIPLSRGGIIEMKWQQEQPVLFGNPVDKLGRYEDIGTPREFAELKARFGAKK